MSDREHWADGTGRLRDPAASTLSLFSPPGRRCSSSAIRRSRQRSESTLKSSARPEGVDYHGTTTADVSTTLSQLRTPSLKGNTRTIAHVLHGIHVWNAPQRTEDSVDGLQYSISTRSDLKAYCPSSEGDVRIRRPARVRTRSLLVRRARRARRPSPLPWSGCARGCRCRGARRSCDALR